jgi:hypothetical protein
MTEITSHAVLDLMPHFAAEPRVRGSRPLDMIDISPARRYVHWRGAQALHVLTFDFELAREEIREVEDFFGAMRGKWRPFFIPSWQSELEPTEDVANGGTSLTISQVDYAETYYGDEELLTALGKHLFLLHEDGTMHLCRVTEVTGGGSDDDEVLTFTPPAPKAFEVGRFMVGFLYLVRFVHDELEMAFAGPDHARCTITVHEINGYGVDTFNPSLCAVPDFGADGGGDTFDCYVDGPVSGSLPLAGTSFDGAWIIADNLLRYPRGDDFETYLNGDVDESVLAAGDGYTGPWIKTPKNTEPIFPVPAFVRYEMDALTGLSDGNAITSLTDVGDKLNNWHLNATPGSGTHPTYRTPIINGLPVARFINTNVKALIGGSAATIFRNVGGGSIAAVVRASSVPTSRRVLFGATTSVFFARLGLYAGGVSNRWAVAGRRLDSDTFQEVSSTSDVGTDWHIVIGVAHHAIANARLYVDGVKEADVPFQTAGNTSDTNGGHMTMSSETSGQSWLGDIAAVAAWPYALDEDRVQTLTQHWAEKYAITLP